jgi:POT family proton-dependent oligopeptide transporter
VALNRGGIPQDVGQPPIDLDQVRFASMRVDWWVYLGIAIAIPVFALLIQRNEIAGVLLWVFGLIAMGYLLMYAVTSEKVERERLFVVLILTFFSFLFWAFFEQAGSSLNNFADRNVDRVFEQQRVGPEDVGTSVDLTLTQEQLGFPQQEELFTLNDLAEARESDETQQSWVLSEDHLGMGIAGAGDEVPASTFQSANPIFIVIFGLVLTWLWGALASQGMEPSTPFKFALGLLQLGLGFAVFWYAARQADARGMTAPIWLLLGYLLHTTGELCLSPVGLSMVTKLSPGRIVSTVMGGWFVATACSNFLAGQIAQMTGVKETESEQIPPPQETIELFGHVYGQIAVIAIACSVVCFLLVPLLKSWMHVEADQR